MQHAPNYWPTEDWRTAPPEEVQVDPAILAQMLEYIDATIPGLHNILIVRHGYLAFETYYQGFHKDSYNNIASATKSIVSLLIGIALAEGKLTSIDQPMLDFFPELASQETDPRKHAVTLRHLLNLTGGFSHEFPHEYWLNPVALAIQRPMLHQPGEVFYYDSHDVDILAGILTRVTGMNAATYAHTTLFATLGIWQHDNMRFIWQREPQGAHTWHGDAYWDEQNGFPWKVDPQGHNTGSFGLHLTARDMAKIGYLCLKQGTWNGSHMLPAAYFTQSIHQQSAGGPPLNTPYGFLWWLTTHQGHPAFFASGYSGRLIYVIPSLDLVIVTTASTLTVRDHPDQAKQITDLIPRFIFPALHDMDGSPTMHTT